MPFFSSWETKAGRELHRLIDFAQLPHALASLHAPKVLWLCVRRFRRSNTGYELEHQQTSKKPIYAKPYAFAYTFLTRPKKVQCNLNPKVQIAKEFLVFKAC